MIFYYTDNSVSQAVAKAFVSAGHEARHIRDFVPAPSIFYGIMRGAGNAMHRLNALGIDYWYVDNGYFDAEYINDQKEKLMTGTYRIVKNDTHHKYEREVYYTERQKHRTMVIPPSEVSAYFHGTTPQDWVEHVTKNMDNFFVRDKSVRRELEDDLEQCDAVLAFNSMAVIQALKAGKIVEDTHGVFRNHAEDFQSMYRIGDVIDYFKDKQFTLQQIADGAWTP